MDIAAVNRNHVPITAPSELPPEKASEHRAIVQAVKAVNETEMFGQDNLLAFQRDPETQRIVVQVINRKTHEVVSQIPAEYLLRLAEDVKQQKGAASASRTG